MAHPDMTGVLPTPTVKLEYWVKSEVIIDK